MVVLMVTGHLAGTLQLPYGAQNVGPSGQAEQMISRDFPRHAVEDVLFDSPSLRVADPAYRAAIRDVLGRIRATGRVTQIQSPLDPRFANQVSATRHAALLQFRITGSISDSAARVVPVLAAVRDAAAAHPQVRIAETGDASINKAINDTVLRDLHRAELLSFPITLVVLLIAFGAVVAALLPLGLATVAILAAGGLVAFTSRLSGVGVQATSVMLLIGLAVGVDYSMFYVKRQREERAAGQPLLDAIETAAATSGRSVLISGLTVLLAMSGMFLTGSKIFYGIGQATMLVVAVAVIASLTLLPALLALLGDRVDRGRLPFAGRARRTAGQGRVWTAVLDRVLSRPGRSAVLATGLLLALAAPALSMHTEFLSVQQMLPSSTPIIQRYDHIMAAFPGGPTPAVVVVKAPDIRSAVAQRQIAALTSYRSSALGQPVHTTVYPAANLAEVDIPLAGSGNDAVSRQALATLHDTIVPATVGKIPGGTALVGGDLAQRLDWNSQMASSIVPVILFVMGITFVLMLISFGSLVIAATSMALNVLSVGAAYGALSAVFVHGWGASLIGTQAPGAIESWIPLFVFVVLFGLSMDYNVFVVSRIREGHDHGLPTRQAVAYGIRSTAGVVTSAAIIMVAVFAVFGTLSVQQFKQLAVGLAISVLIDATVIRGVLLPSVMVLLGDRNWYLPRWLGRFTAGGAGRRPPLAGHPGRVEPGLQRVPSPSLEDP